MTYRDDLGAAQARAEAAERENERLRERLAEVAEERGRARALKIPLPKHFKLEETPSSLRVSWRWFKPQQHIFMLFFCIAWDAFLFFWYTGGATRGGWLFVVFPLVHVAVGIGITYSTIAGFLNRTRVIVEDGVLRTRVGPVPWAGNHTIARADLEQLYVTEKMSSTKSGSRTAYRLEAMDRSGQQHTLVRDLESVDQARWLEIAIERRLGIVDEPVLGEARREDLPTSS